MRPDLPPALAAALARCERPSLVFDLAQIDANLAAIARAARSAEVTALFAAKSFPHPAVRALAAMHLAGFDAASPAEVCDACDAAREPGAARARDRRRGAVARPADRELRDRRAGRFGAAGRRDRDPDLDVADRLRSGD